MAKPKTTDPTTYMTTTAAHDLIEGLVRTLDTLVKGGQHIEGAEQDVRALMPTTSEYTVALAAAVILRRERANLARVNQSLAALSEV